MFLLFFPFICIFFHMLSVPSVCPSVFRNSHLCHHSACFIRLNRPYASSSCSTPPVNLLFFHAACPHVSSSFFSPTFHFVLSGKSVLLCTPFPFRMFPRLLLHPFAMHSYHNEYLFRGFSSVISSWNFYLDFTPPLQVLEKRQRSKFKKI